METNNQLIKIAIIGLAIIGASSSYATMKDITLESKAKLVMLLKKGVPAVDIKTHADKGRLQIAGYVNSAEQLSQVENAIRGYLDQEKHQIINNVKVCTAKSSLNDELKFEKNVKKHLEQENYPLTDVTIQTKANNVMLSGFVDTALDITKATTIVKKVPGVTNVDNFLLRKEK